MSIDTIASISVSLADPAGASPLIAAMLWLQNTVLGTIALTVAIIAVASVGFMMLSGRVNLRYGATVIVGCFVLFGASSIVVGIQSALGERGGGSPDVVPETAAVVIPPSAPRSSDPYAGASVPPR